jgi:hypothetical protein
LLGLLSDVSAPDFLLIPLALDPLEEPDTPVSELCELVPARLSDRRGDVDVSEPVVPDIPLEPDISDELTPSCCAVSESTLPVTFRLFDF